MPRGRVPHVRRRAEIGRDPRPAHREGHRLARREGPRLHQRPRGPSGDRAVKGPEMDTEIENPLHRLTPEQIEAIGKEFDQLHEEVHDDLGDRDARYIRSMIELHRRLALLGRVLLVGSRYKPLWAAGTATLSLAKILENMEIGHNVMHGQWDWMNDPVINSAAGAWDTASTPKGGAYSHNYVHHTYTNIRGKDKALGYEIMRIDPHQRWNPVYLAQPFYNLVLASFFEWGVASHDLDFEAIRKGEKPKEKVVEELKGMARKGGTQIAKDYIAYPALAGAAGAAVGALRGGRKGAIDGFKDAYKSNLKA